MGVEGEGVEEAGLEFEEARVEGLVGGVGEVVGWWVVGGWRGGGREEEGGGGREEVGVDEGDVAWGDGGGADFGDEVEGRGGDVLGVG